MKKSIIFKKKYQKKNELIGFVADQFKKLAKKNLRIPVTLYHLSFTRLIMDYVISIIENF